MSRPSIAAAKRRSLWRRASSREGRDEDDEDDEVDEGSCGGAEVVLDRGVSGDDRRVSRPEPDPTVESEGWFVEGASPRAPLTVDGKACDRIPARRRRSSAVIVAKAASRVILLKASRFPTPHCAHIHSAVGLGPRRKMSLSAMIASSTATVPDSSFPIAEVTVSARRLMLSVDSGTDEDDDDDNEEDVEEGGVEAPAGGEDTVGSSPSDSSEEVRVGDPIARHTTGRHQPQQKTQPAVHKWTERRKRRAV
jgi:hypothetical protein